MMIERILLVAADDMRKDLEPRWRIRSVPSLAAAQQVLDDGQTDLVLAGVQLPDGTAADLLPHLESIPGHPLLIVFAASTASTEAIDCVQRGAFGFLPKPCPTNQLLAMLQRADDHARLARAAQCPHCSGHRELIGRSPAIEQLRSQIRKVARTDATILIQGEHHTGKSLVARMIHRLSPRIDAPLLHVDCAMLPEHRIGAELFGEDSTSSGTRAGMFELAQGGTLLLEEVGVLPLQEQKRLLQLLESRTLVRGANRPSVALNVRIIATTSRDLPKMVRQQTFCEALFHALSVVPLRTPPLRDRAEDIAPLAEHFRNIAARRHGKNVPAVTPQLAAALQAHTWPGNIRELQDTIERGVLACDGGVLEPGHIVGAAGQGLAPLKAEAANADIELLDDAERRHILIVLNRCNGNRTHAARRLGVSLRTLRNKLREYRLRSEITETIAPRSSKENCLMASTTGLLA